MYKIIGGDLKEYGPVSAEDLRRWIAEGRVTGQTQVLAADGAEWKPLSSFPEFADSLPERGTFSGQPSATVGALAGLPADVLTRDYDLNIGACVRRSWELLKKNFGMVFGGTAVYMLVQILLSVLGRIPHLGLVVTIGNVIFLAGPLMGGLYLFLLKNIRRQPVEIGDVFSGFRLTYVQLILAYLAMALLSAIVAVPGGGMVGVSVFQMVRHHAVDGAHLAVAVLGSLVAMVPLIYLSTSWIFALALVIDQRMEFWPAMELSRKMASKHWWTIFGFLIVCGLINVVGVLACCVGVFVSMPIVFGAMMYAYEDIFTATRPPGA